MKFIIIFLVSSLWSQNAPVQRPDPDKVIKTIEGINITDEQKKKIYKDLEKNVKNYDKEKKKYDKKMLEKEQIEKEMESIKNNMIELNKNVTYIIKSYLDDEQLNKFEDLVKKQKEKVSQSKPKETKEIEEKKEDKPAETKSPFSIYFP